MELFGSTNLSNKGLRDNWELTGVVEFDPSDPESVANQRRSLDAFERVWEGESIVVDSRRIADLHFQGSTLPDRAIRYSEYRYDLMRFLIRKIQQYEQEIGSWVAEQATQPRFRDAVAAREAEGTAPGYALLQTLREQKSSEEIDAVRQTLPAWADLARLQQGLPPADWGTDQG